jgi:hypothetical protein
MPLPHDLDGSRLLLPYPERVGEGRRTFLPALNVTVVSWWNRVFDERGAVNSHIIQRGRVDFDVMWRIFNLQFPDLAKAHTRPDIAEAY